MHVATITGSDPDGTLAYELLNGAGAFTIDSIGRIFAQTSFNYEARSAYDIGIRAWDGGSVSAGNAFDTTVRINITDQAEAPTLAFVPRTDGVMGTYVGQFVPSDPDAGSSFTYELISADQERDSGLVSARQRGVGPRRRWWRPAEQRHPQFGRPAVLRPHVPARSTVPAASAGERSTTTIRSGELRIGFGTTPISPATPSRWNSWGTSGRVLPIVIDLDGTGSSSSRSMSRSDGVLDEAMPAPTLRTGWVGADVPCSRSIRNGDGSISGRTEISFVDDAPFATSDLEGLVTYDTNEDGYLNAGDARFGEFLDVAGRESGRRGVRPKKLRSARGYWHRSHRPHALAHGPDHKRRARWRT